MPRDLYITKKIQGFSIKLSGCHIGIGIQLLYNMLSLIMEHQLLECIAKLSCFLDSV